MEGVTFPISTNQALQFGTLPGVFAAGLRNVQEKLAILQRPTDEWQKQHRGSSQLWDGTMMTQSTKAIYVPFWFLILSSASLAVAPWIGQMNRRYSLRTRLDLVAQLLILLRRWVFASHAGKLPRSGRNNNVGFLLNQHVASRSS